MKATKSILFLCAALTFAASCNKDVDMTLTQKTLFENADIRQIAVGDAWQVTLVADSSTFVELEYSAYLESYVKARMTGNQLEIGFKGRVYPAINSVFRTTIHTAQLEQLEASDAATVQCSGDFGGQGLEIDLSDASACNGLAFSGEDCIVKMENASLLTGFRFAGSRCTATLEEASQFNGRIEADEQLEVELEEASRFVNKGGVTAVATIKGRDGSMLNMVETRVGEMHVELSNASEATVWVEATLDGTLKEASTLYYKGHPQIQVNCSEDSELIPL